MISPDEMLKLVGAMRAARVDELVWNTGAAAVKLSIADHPGGVEQATHHAAAPGSLLELRLARQAVGRFYRSHPRSEERARLQGSSVGTGEPIGYLAIGPALTELVSPVSGTIAYGDITDGDLIGVESLIATLSPAGTGKGAMV